MLSRRSRSSRPVNLWLAAFTVAMAIQAPCNAADKIRIGYTSPTPNHGVLWVADTSNLFKKNNLDLEIVYMPGNISLPRCHSRMFLSRVQVWFRLDSRRFENLTVPRKIEELKLSGMTVSY